MSIINQKQQLRDHVYNQLKIHSDDVLNQSSSAVQNLLIHHSLFKKSRTIALYFPFRKEMDTSLIFTEAKRANKAVAFPKIFLQEEKIEFYWVDSWGDFEPSRWGLKEPLFNSSENKADLNQIDLIVVPSVALTLDGARLGRGKGYYDRLLSTYKGETVGIGYQFQIFESIPEEKTDQKVKWIACEKAVFHVSSR